jgi:branched-chain amino acid transport system substrate-binding protein
MRPRCRGRRSSEGCKSRNAVAAWAAYLNGHGGINGHPVKIFYQDDADDPAKSIVAVHQMVSGNHVVAILDASNQGA